MEAKQWTTIDKSAWHARGEWDSEPDKAQWQDEATGLPCLIVRGPSGALCGYVGVPEGHRFFGVDYNEVHFAPEYGDDGYYPDVHGGLTFADKCSPSNDESRGICHMPAPGEPDHVWWLGFDCAHSGDFCPAHSRPEYNRWDETYKSLAYVQRQVAKLAKQLAAAPIDSTKEQ